MNFLSEVFEGFFVTFLITILVTIFITEILLRKRAPGASGELRTVPPVSVLRSEPLSSRRSSRISSWSEENGEDASRSKLGTKRDRMKLRIERKKLLNLLRFKNEKRLQEILSSNPQCITDPLK